MRDFLISRDAEVYSLADLLPPRSTTQPRRRRGSVVEGPTGFGAVSGEVNNEEASKIESHDSEPGTRNGLITWFYQDFRTLTHLVTNILIISNATFCDYKPLSKN